MILDSQQGDDELLKRLASCHGEKNSLVLTEMLNAGMQFTESTFFNVFVNGRHSGRTTVRVLNVVKKALSSPKDRWRLFIVTDHQRRWVCHLLAAEMVADELDKYPRIIWKRFGILLFTKATDDSGEPSGDFSE